MMKRKAYPCEDYEELFDMPQAEERQVDNRGVYGYRMKTMTSRDGSTGEMRKSGSFAC